VAEPFLLRRIDVLLVDLVQELDLEYPELPYGLVARCVEVAGRQVSRQPSPSDDLTGIVAAVAAAAREDLNRICASVPAASV
jgi:hypothetical protein